MELQFFASSRWSRASSSNSILRALRPALSYFVPDFPFWGLVDLFLSFPCDVFVFLGLLGESFWKWLYWPE